MTEPNAVQPRSDPDTPTTGKFKQVLFSVLGALGIALWVIILFGYGMFQLAAYLKGIDTFFGWEMVMYHFGCSYSLYCMNINEFTRPTN